MICNWIRHRCARVARWCTVIRLTGRNEEVFGERDVNPLMMRLKCEESGHLRTLLAFLFSSVHAYGHRDRRFSRSLQLPALMSCRLRFDPQITRVSPSGANASPRNDEEENGPMVNSSRPD